MLVFIRMTDNHTITLKVETNDTISNVKVLITWEEGIPHNQQSLSFADQWLEDRSTLSYYNIKNADTLNLHEKVIHNTHTHLLTCFE